MMNTTKRSLFILLGGDNAEPEPNFNMKLLSCVFGKNIEKEPTNRKNETLKLLWYFKSTSLRYRTWFLSHLLANHTSPLLTFYTTEFNFVSGWYVHILHCHYETHTKHKINLFWNTAILQQVLIDAISESIAMSSGAARVCVTYTNLEMAEIKFNVAIL